MSKTPPGNRAHASEVEITSTAASSRHPIRRYTSTSRLAARRTSFAMTRPRSENVSDNETTPTRIKRKRRQEVLGPALEPSALDTRAIMYSTSHTGAVKDETSPLFVTSEASTLAQPRHGPPPSTPPRSLRRTVSDSVNSSPRDLSSHFSPTRSPRINATPSTPKRPGGMRRMLTKTQSLGEPVEGAITEKALTFSSPFSSPSRSIDTPPRSLFSADDMDESDNILSEKPARTYGSSRTVQTLQSLETEEVGEERETYAELRQKYEIVNEDSWPTEAARAPLPITDMRSKGENRRFLDEVGYLVEGLRDAGSSLSSRRYSSYDILRNIQDETWANKVQVCDQSVRLWSSLMEARGDGDIVIDAISLLFLSFCANSTVGLESISLHASEQCLRLINIGMQKDGPLEAVASAKGRTSAKVYGMIHDLLEERETKVPRSIGTWLFARLLDIDPSTCVPSFPAVLHCVRSEVSQEECDTRLFYENLKIVSRLIVHDSSLEVDPQTCQHLVKALSIAKARAAQDGLAFPIMLELLQILIIASQSVKLDLQPHTIAWITLRTGDIADALNESDVSGKDVLSLALAVLTSTMGRDEALITSIANLSLSATCSGLKHCAIRCHCSHQDLFAHHLARKYAEHVDLDTKVDEVIRGYLAIIIAKLLVKGPNCRTTLLARIPGLNPKDKLENLLVDLSQLEIYIGSEGGDEAESLGGVIKEIEAMRSAVS